MEGVSTSVYKGLRRYWRRMGYRKLNGSGRRRPTKVVLGGKRVWKVKVAPKLKLSRVVSAPKRLLVWLRDAYVNMMLKLAGSQAFSVGYGGALGGGGFGGGGLKEYDEKMIVEIYKSLVIAQGLVPRDAGRIGSHIVSERAVLDCGK